MRSFYISVFFISCLLTHQANGQTFVEACLEKTEILNNILECTTLSNTVFKLDKGLKIQVASKTGKQKSFNTQKIRHLPGRITDLGFQPHSVMFMSEQNNLNVTISIPCGQSAYAYVGLGAQKEGLPYEQVAECHIK
ncbi:MAG: hypothetical protein IPM57_00895 [Oligoflexia bacterium]|nr:hypothetical protein [Oligoflexia bacterium]